MRLSYARAVLCSRRKVCAWWKNNQGRRKEWSCCGAVLSDSNISSHRRSRRTIFSTLTLFNFFYATCIRLFFCCRIRFDWLTAAVAAAGLDIFLLRVCCFEDEKQVERKFEPPAAVAPKQNRYFCLSRARRYTIALFALVSQSSVYQSEAKVVWRLAHCRLSWREMPTRQNMRF